jgi:hypothetical protein
MVRSIRCRSFSAVEGPGRSPAELRDIRRLSVLKAASAFAASRPDMKSADVVVVAERWLAWVEAKPGTPLGVD